MSLPEPVAEARQFIFVICQNGAEAAARKEITQAHPNLRLAFSRPGFITFIAEPDSTFPEKFLLRSTLARTYGWSLGKVTGDDATQLVAEVQQKHQLSEYQNLHIWQRDLNVPGNRGFEPGISLLATEIGRIFETTLSDGGHPITINQVAQPDEKVFDIVMVEPDQWWLGYHFATTVAGRWPGGVPLIDTSVETVSRAYLKAREALEWSGICIQPDDWCAEIGSAPGGCCQLLLELGANVIGVDPAEMEPEVLANPKFTHIRRRGHEVKKRDFQSVKWLFADLNIVPNYTLDTISEIVGHESVDVKGMILTLKLTDWKFIEEVPNLMNRVRELGFSVVKARQLAFNRQEFCLVAVKDKFVLRIGKKQSHAKRKKTES